MKTLIQYYLYVGILILLTTCSAFAQSSAVTLTAYPNPITTGQSTILTWTGLNGSNCTASNGWSGTKSLVGTEVVAPASTTTYTLSCSGSPTDSVTVTVMTGTQFYIDPATGNDGNPGTIGSPWATIDKANTTLTAGQTVWLRAGTYVEYILPTNNGSAGNYITFAAYPGETVILGDGSQPYGANLASKSYIIIQGVQIRDPWFRGINLDGASNIYIRGITLEGNTNTGQPSAIDMRNSANNIAIQSSTIRTITQGPDCASGAPGDCQGFWELIIATSGTHHILIENNTIGKTLHQAFLTFSDSTAVSELVVRNNTFEQRWHTNWSWQPVQHSTYERNVVRFAGEDWETWPWKSASQQNRIAHAGLQTDNYVPASSSNEVIARYNTFYRNGTLTFFGGTENNYFYHNVFYDNFQYAWCCLGFGNGILANNVYKNNIFELNNSLDFYSEVPIEDNFFINNGILTPIWDQPNIVTLASVEAAHPTKWFGNSTAAPVFMDPSSQDFHLQASSPYIDAGAHLTTATSTGSGTSLPVADAKYFTDGYGIVKGDLIQISNGQIARIQSITSNTLTLASSVSWSNGNGVSLIYSGTAPDVGAYEFTSAPGAPSSHISPGVRLIRR